jgi:zinc protease
MGLACVAFAIAASAAMAQPPALDGARIASRSLDNGVRLAVKAEQDAPVVAIAAVVRGGSSVEGESEHGLAHTVEHMIFQRPANGTPTGLLPHTIEALGGEVLAETTRDFTRFTVTIAPDAFEEALAALALAIKEPVVDDQRLRAELRVMQAELDEAYAEPLSVLQLAPFAEFYAGGPYAHSPGGGPGALQVFSADDVRAFHRKHYVGRNIAVIVVGDVETEPALGSAAEHFGRLPDGESAVPSATAVPSTTSKSVTVQSENVQQPVIALAFPAPGVASMEDVCATDVLLALLDHGTHSRLHGPLAERVPGIGPTGAIFLTERLPGVCAVWASVGSASEAAVLEGLRQVLADLAATAPTEEEVRRACLGAKIVHASECDTVTGQAGTLAFYEAIGSYEMAVNYEIEVRKVTPERVRDIVRRCYDPARALEIRVTPKGGGQ